MSREKDCCPCLRGKHISLRPPQERDKQARLAYGRDAEFRKMVGGDPRTLPPLTQAEVEQWYNQMVQECYHWVIEADGQCIGTVCLHALGAHDRRAKYAIGLFVPRFWGRGLGTEATHLVLAFAFDRLHLHRVELRVLSFNQRAIACYEKCGFVREGIEREASCIGGEWQSDVLMSVLEHEYQAGQGAA